MAIQVTCDECGKGYRLPDKKAGRKIRCRQCEAVIQIPDLEEEYDEYEDDGYEDDYESSRPKRRSPTSQSGRRSNARASFGLMITAVSVGAVLVIGMAVGVWMLNAGGVEEIPPLGPNDMVEEPDGTPDRFAGMRPNDAANPEVAGGPAQPAASTPETVDALQPGTPTSPAPGAPNAGAGFIARLPAVKAKLKQIMMALHVHHDTYRMFNPDTGAAGNYAADGRPHLSWRVHILPYVGQADLYQQFKVDEAWDSPHNQALLSRMPDVYRSPGDAPDSTTTRFRGVESVLNNPNARLSTMFAIAPGNRQIRMRDVTDGTSNTVMFVEAAPDKSVPWTKPEELPLVPNDPASAFGAIDPAGVPAAFADGTVKLVSADLAPRVWANLINPTDGQIIPRDAFAAIPDRPVPTIQFTPRTNVPLHLAYMTPDTVGLVVAHPMALVESPQVKDMLTEMSAAGTMPPGMLDVIQELETVVAWVTPADRKSPVHVALQFASASTSEAVAKKIRAKPDDLLQHDDRTWLVGPPTLTAKLAAASRTPSALAESLQDIKTDRHVFARFDMQQAFQQVPQLGMLTASPQMNGLKQIQRIDVTLDMSGTSLLNVEARTSSAAIATLLNDQLQAVLQAELPPNAPPEAKATADAVKQLLVAGIDSEREDTLVISLKNSPELASTILRPLRKALTEARGAAIRTQQKNQLKQVGLAMHNYHDVHRRFPPADNPGTFDADGQPHLSWRVHILPFIDHAPLYEQFHLDEAWDSPHNMALLDEMPDVYQVTGVTKRGHTSLMTFSGPGTGFPNPQGLSFREITDGASNTIAAVQAGPDKAVPWTKPVDLAVDKEDPIASLGEIDRGFNALLFNGAVKFISVDIDSGLLLGLINPSDNR